MQYRVQRHEVIQPQDQSIRLIALTQGLNAIVDAVDYVWLNAFNWCVKWNVSGKSFYAFRTIHTNGRKRNVYMHQVLIPNAEEIDHINHDTLDNRRTNLRPCSKSQNQGNRKPRPSLLGIKGVTLDKREKKSHLKWRAQMMINGKNTSLGYYATAEEAATAYRKAAEEYFGDFAFHKSHG